MSSTKKVLVLGANGLLGHELMSSNFPKGWEVVGHFGRHHEKYADLSATEQTLTYLDDISPDVIINLIALTNVDYCESHPNDACALNTRVVENIVAWIKAQPCYIQLIQISSDQVYDGQGAHSEAAVTLTNYYAFSKYAGELAANQIDAAILRTNLFGKSKTDARTSFSDWLYQALTQNQDIKVFDDVYFSPLSMSTLCQMIIKVILNNLTGTYNLGSNQGLSKADFAFEFASALGATINNMTRTTMDQSGIVKTYRPGDMRLNVKKFEQAMKLSLPNLSDEIIAVAKEYQL
ncbi:SDR family oxidoreductase [uncultured Psychrobacter sp.]|mgnify:CR=1 FL=1|uniref:SDR family oxidoreductase n=1 Tax=uncultured Psychrobacter sp. TaxID=259303 RepID=UPI00261CF018|nr:SDR family oxidoreductase [uncultured Psychrobacter sp.]